MYQHIPLLSKSQKLTIMIIFKGMHRPLFKLPAFISPFGITMSYISHSVVRKVKFYENCAYNIGEKQSDWNKVFGFCLGISGIHENSVRFGWRYNIQKNCIELGRLIYNNCTPEREYLEGCDVQFGEEVKLELQFEWQGDFLDIKFLVNDNVVYCTHIIECVSSLFYFGCSLYFGGKTKAPHKMKVRMRRG